MVGRKNGGEKWLEAAYSTYDTRLKPTNLKGGRNFRCFVFTRMHDGIYCSVEDIHVWVHSTNSIIPNENDAFVNFAVTSQYHKNDAELIKGTEADEDKNHQVVLLDPLGKMYTSEAFSENMYRWLEEGGSRLTFVIGGAEGLPEEMKKGGGGRHLFSLGKMTLTHQFARILLMEQIYRASEIRKGSGYHK